MFSQKKGSKLAHLTNMLKDPTIAYFQGSMLKLGLACLRKNLSCREN